MADKQIVEAVDRATAAAPAHVDGALTVHEVAGSGVRDKTPETDSLAKV